MSRPGLRELWEIGQRDAFVRSRWQEWLLGNYPSFEALLISMVVELLTTRNQLVEELVSRAQRETKTGPEVGGGPGGGVGGTETDRPEAAPAGGPQ